MGILALSADERVRDVRVSEDTLMVDLMDGRTISVPLVWYPRLFGGTAKQPVTASTGQTSTKISARRACYAAHRRPHARRGAQRSAPGNGEKRAEREH